MVGIQGIGMNSFGVVGSLRRTIIDPSDDNLGFGR
jgi:hypothetical protein